MELKEELEWQESPEEGFEELEEDENGLEIYAQMLLLQKKAKVTLPILLKSLSLKEKDVVGVYLIGR
jgi:hypothetical protein